MRSPGPYLESRSGSIAAILGGVGLMAALGIYFNSLPRVLAGMLFVASAIVALLGVWGLFSRQRRETAKQSAAPPSPRKRTAFTITNSRDIRIIGGSSKGYDKFIDAKDSKDIHVEDHDLE